MKHSFTRFLAFLLMLFLLATSTLPAFAEEAKTPAAIQDTYTVNGITYYNVNSTRFDSPAHYLPDLMTTKSSELGNKSMAALWLETGVGMSMDSPSMQGTSPFNVDRKLALDTITSAIAAGASQQNGNFKAGFIAPVYAASIQNAASSLQNSLPSELMNLGSISSVFLPYNSSNSTELAAAQKKQDVIAAACYGYQNDCLVIAEVYFTDFQAIALLPDNKGTNYVTTTIRDNKKADRTYASNVKNLTLSPVTASQNVSTSWTSSVTSTVNHSSTYTLSETIKLGFEIAFTLAKTNTEFTVSASKAVTDGWSKATTETKSGTVSDTVSVSLPPYTTVLLEQGNTSTEAETKYNCPIGLKYKATVRMIAKWSDPGTTNLSRASTGNAVFGADARLDLYNRALRDGDLDIDKEVHWPNVLTIEGMRERLTNLTSHVPMSPVGASFRETKDTTYTEVKSIAPTEPLYRVKLLPPDENSRQLNYGNLNYLHRDMKVGEASYTNYLRLKGENAFDAEYYGFSSHYGHWIVIHPDGTEWTDETAPVKLEKDPATGYLRYTALRPGTCFLKYIIDESSYASDESLQSYTKNSDLESTAALEITVSGVVEEVKPTGTITVSGNYFGFVGRDPEPLDGDDGLTVSIQDFSGKELDKPYHWEKKELDSRGIQIDDENEVSFTKTGKYHVRAVCDDIAAKSDWYEIEVHNYTFTGEGASIMASCTDPECDDVMFTVHRPQKTVFGDGKSAWASVTGQIPGLTTPAVSYFRGTEKLSAPPRDAGTYTASITIGEAKAEVEYTIEKATPVIQTPPTASAISEGQSLSESILSGGKANTTGTFAWTDGTIRPGSGDPEGTEYEVTFTPDSANYAPATCRVILGVENGPAAVIRAPEALSLTYTGEEQPLVRPGAASNGSIFYALTTEPGAEPEVQDYSETVPGAIEAGTYYVWYELRAADELTDFEPVRLETTIQRASPAVEFPVRRLLADGTVQPLIVDPIVTPAKGVTVRYSLGDTENELLSSPVAMEPGKYYVYYRIESDTPSCDSVPWGEPVLIEIQTSLAEQLPELAVSQEGWTYGEEANVPVVSGSGNMPVYFLYKRMGEPDESFTEAVPTDAGDYIVRAVVNSPDYYGEATAEAEFQIEKRVPVFGEDYSILPEIVSADGSYRPLVDITVKEGSSLKLWCSFDRRNTLAGTPKKRAPGVYEIWYKVTGDPNYVELSDWNGPVTASLLSPITATVLNAARFADGTPFEPEFSIDGLLDGYTATVTGFSDTITEPGFKSVSVTGLSVTDPAGLDVTESCTIHTVPGTLVLLPEQPDFTVPAMLREIGEEAFASIRAETILLPETVETVQAYAFAGGPSTKAVVFLGMETLFEEDALAGCENLLVIAPEGSSAQSYAEAKGLDFVPLAGTRA